MKSKFVIVTGCTRGLGHAMVEEFCRLGHRVAGCGRQTEALDAMRKRFGTGHSFEQVDVASDTAVGAWARHVLSAGVVPDLLINNAGLINANAPLWLVPPEEFARVINVNLKGVHHVIRHFLPSMIKMKRGVVVNFSSGWGRSTDAEVAPYCATKWGIEGLTQALAAELPEGMAAVPLNPGIIHTEMLESCFGASARQYPSPKKWAARAVPFLLELGPQDNGRALTAP